MANNNKYDQNKVKPQKVDNSLNIRYQNSKFQRPPNGPDYTSSTVLQNNENIVRDSVPLRVGLDLYPMTDEGLTGKQGAFGLTGDNKHEVLLHLNLFSKKPSNFGGREYVKIS